MIATSYFKQKNALLLACFFTVYIALIGGSYSAFIKSPSSINQESVVNEFLTNLHLLYATKNWERERECVALIGDPTQAVISSTIIERFDLTIDKDITSEEIPISLFLQWIRRAEIEGEIIVNKVEYCDEEKLAGNQLYHRLSASIEIRTKQSKQKATITFGLISSNDPEDTQYKIVAINYASCNKPNATLTHCAPAFEKAKSLIQAQKYHQAEILLNGLENCSNNQIQNLLAECRIAKREKYRRDSIQREQEKMAENIRREREQLDEQRYKEAKTLFYDKQYASAKRKYEAIQTRDVSQEITKCDKCILASQYINKGKQQVSRQDNIQAFEAFSKASTLCPNATNERLLTSVRDKITSQYIKGAESLVKERRYSDAISLIRHVYVFDKTNQRAKEIEATCKRYSDPALIKKEIAKAKKLFENPKASPRQNAEAFQILYGLRYSSYMDGEAYTYLGAMEYQPKKYGLHKQLNISSKEIKAFWRIHIKQAINECKKKGNCNEDVNFFLSGLEEELYKK